MTICPDLQWIPLSRSKRPASAGRRTAGPGARLEHERIATWRMAFSKRTTNDSENDKAGRKGLKKSPLLRHYCPVRQQMVTVPGWKHNRFRDANNHLGHESSGFDVSYHRKGGECSSSMVSVRLSASFYLRHSDANSKELEQTGGIPRRHRWKMILFLNTDTFPCF